MLAPHLARFLQQHHLPRHPDFTALVRRLCDAVDSGSSCLDLSAQPERSISAWRELLNCDQKDSSVASPDNSAPLILTEDNKLYLQRYYLHEHTIFNSVNLRFNHPTPTLSQDLLTRTKQLFGSIENNDQATAALRALANHFTIISGGPGTGKTTTVLKILLLLKQQNAFTESTDCLLLAPTGKAADRLRQSILGGIQKLGIDDPDFPTETSTIHRALGYRHGSIEFHHNAQNPLNAKLVIVDESSMVDLTLMSRLLSAIKPDARIILLGDRNQLASVQVGTVLADLMDVAKDPSQALHQSSITLEKSYRTHGTISATCTAIREGKSEQAWDYITTSDPTSLGAIIHQNLPNNPRSALAEFVTKHWLPVLTDSSLTDQQKLESIDNFRILCPTHNGPYGINAINAAVDQILSQHGISTSDIWYTGRSIIVQKNDYTLGIFNGDTGLVCKNEDEAEESAYVCFHSSDGSPRTVSPALLPEVSSAWALTIHRTQGSEYDHILLIIPPAEDSQILSRELLYTGLSRAKKSATIWCDQQSLQTTINTTVQRASGLAEMFCK